MRRPSRKHRRRGSPRHSWLSARYHDEGDAGKRAGLMYEIDSARDVFRLLEFILAEDGV